MSITLDYESREKIIKEIMKLPPGAIGELIYTNAELSFWFLRTLELLDDEDLFIIAKKCLKLRVKVEIE